MADEWHSLLIGWHTAVLLLSAQIVRIPQGGGGKPAVMVFGWYTAVVLLKVLLVPHGDQQTSRHSSGLAHSCCSTSCTDSSYSTGRQAVVMVVVWYSATVLSTFSTVDLYSNGGR